MKTGTLRNSLAFAAALAMSAAPGAIAHPAPIDSAAPMAAPKWERRSTGRKIKSWKRDRTPLTAIPLAGCLTPDALRERRAMKSHGFEHTTTRGEWVTLIARAKATRS